MIALMMEDTRRYSPEDSHRNSDNTRLLERIRKKCVTLKKVGFLYILKTQRKPSFTEVLDISYNSQTLFYDQDP
jgi:hypothetical protein